MTHRARTVDGSEVGGEWANGRYLVTGELSEISAELAAYLSVRGDIEIVDDEEDESVQLALPEAEEVEEEAAEAEAEADSDTDADDVPKEEEA